MIKIILKLLLNINDIVELTRVTHSQIEEARTLSTRRNQNGEFLEMAYALKTTKIRSHLLFQMRIFFPLVACAIYSLVYSFFFFKERNTRLNENDPRYRLVMTSKDEPRYHFCLH